jgi:Transcriptional regulator, contains sigma factor-related N-terminal domain
MENNEKVKPITLEDIAKLYNGGLSLQKIAESMGTSKSTVQRTLAKGGYVLNKKTKKYEMNVSHETINIENNVLNENNETINKVDTVSNKSNVSHETMINRTYAISDKMDRAIKIKSAIEGKKPIDIVREALQSYIEDKYFDM